MSIKKMIVTTLNPIVPTSPLRYTGEAATYITFFKYLKKGEAFAEGKEKETGHYYQIDIWQKSIDKPQPDVWNLENQVETVLKGIGFSDFTSYDLYENDTKTQHIAIRCFYLQNALDSY